MLLYLCYGVETMTDKVVRLIDREVIKHSAAIQIRGSVGLLARRAWNVMLAHAYDKLTDTDEHTIKMSDLAAALEFDSNNFDGLKGPMRELVNASVEWNALEKDKEATWGVSSLLAHIQFDRGVAKFSYSPFLRRMLHEPRMYARIKLSLQNAFKSKYSLILYELMLDYFDAGRQTGETPWISLEKFRELMGVDDSQYPAFKALGQWVIKPAVDEVSARSDLAVEVQYQRESRRVVALKFSAKPRKGKKVKVRNPSASPKTPGRKKPGRPDPHVSEHKGPVDRGIGTGW